MSELYASVKTAQQDNTVRRMRMARRQNDAGIIPVEIDRQKADVLRRNILEFVGEL